MYFCDTRKNDDRTTVHDQFAIMNANHMNIYYNVYENYITIKGGAKDGIKPDMGVINSLGIIGIIDNTSEKYATVVSILNRKSQINAKIKKTNHY